MGDRALSVSLDGALCVATRTGPAVAVPLPGGKAARDAARGEGDEPELINPDLEAVLPLDLAGS